MKVIDIARQFCTKNIFDSIFNLGGSLSDLGDLAGKTVKHCYVEKRVLFVEVRESWEAKE